MNSAPAWVYMLRCGPEEKLYIGWTTDPQRRLRQHQAGRGGRFTRAHQPVTLVGLRPCASRREARQLEGQLKQLDRAGRLTWIAAHPAERG